MTSSRTLFKELAGKPGAGRTLEILQDLSSRPLRAKELLLLHEALLFYKAYPRSKEIRRFCEIELQGFYARARSLDEDERQLLDQSGVVGSRLFYGYDDSTTRWLISRQTGQMDLDWEAYDDLDSDPLATHLPAFLSPAEQDATDDQTLSVQEIVDAARGSQSALEWVLERFEAVYSESTRADFYNPLQLPLKLELIPEGPSRTLVDDGQPGQLFLWDPEAARAKFDLVKEVLKPLKLPQPLPRKKGEYYLNFAHAVLLIRLRELYPMTHGNPEEVYDIPLERGVRVIWWFMKPDIRLPLEAGWACILLKNNVPIGYGAGGILADRNEISINIFDTFRGGEAAWLYAQYARICHSLCPAPWLTTRKWQLGGEGNEEGLVSGSYWFYDKLGFRSTDSQLRRLADGERKKIAMKKGYRTPKRVLRKLAEADVVLSLEGHSAAEYSEYPLGAASMLTMQVIARQFNGNREKLIPQVLRELHTRFGLETENWTHHEKNRGALMAILCFAIPDFGKWSESQKKSVFEMCRLKGSHAEADYARGMRGNLKFFEVIRRESGK